MDLTASASQNLRNDIVQKQSCIQFCEKYAVRENRVIRTRHIKDLIRVIERDSFIPLVDLVVQHIVVKQINILNTIDPNIRVKGIDDLLRNRLGDYFLSSLLCSIDIGSTGLQKLILQ